MVKGKRKVSYDLYGKLQVATIEREVEDAWNGGISLFFVDSPIEHPYSCDGFLTEGLLLRLIIEYKYDEKLSTFAGRARVLVQVLFYMKRFENDGLPLPNVIMVADKNECFVIHTNEVMSYLDEKVDWTAAPSEAAELNPAFVAKVASDTVINPFIFNVREGFDLSPIVNRIRDLSVNVKRYVRVTEHNIANIFDYYVRNVLREPNKLEAHELVESFMGVLLEPMDYYQHPKNKNILVTKAGKVPIFGDAYLSFFDFYNQNYTPQEKMKFTEIVDRLIEDVTRRRNGEFFTPTPFVDYGHRMLEKAFGENWKDGYVVWDCCCGTKNLTRDYRFGELYCSTLNDEELRMSERYNPEAVSFRFDFLNGDLADLPKGLKEALKKDRPIVFILNPPYAKNTGKGKLAGTTEEVCYTMVRDRMNDIGLDACVANLYAQFLFRILMIRDEFGLNNLKIGVFCPTLFLTGISWKGFREWFLDRFRFLDGVFFQASYFSNVSESWGIAFTVWDCGETVNKRSFDMGLLDAVNDGIGLVGRHVLYNIDDAVTASVWVREETKGMTTYDGVNLTSAIKVREVPGTRKGMLVKDALGYFYVAGNNVDKNVSHVAMYSAAASLGIGVSVIPENFEKCCALFAARKLISKNWINSKDEYLTPDVNHPGWREFVNDSIIFTLFHPSGNQSSLRNVEFDGKNWNIKNEFFWMSRTRMMELANDNGNMDCYSGARTDSERFAFEHLSRLTLSAEARAVFRKACRIVEVTFPYRLVFDEEHPEYQINNWDCGWYQVKAVAALYAKNELEEFKSLFVTLCDKMRPNVYNLGFLL